MAGARFGCDGNSLRVKFEGKIDGSSSGLLGCHKAKSPRVEMARRSKVMSNKMLSSRVNKTKMLFSKIEEARELAKRLERLSQAVEERDNALYKFFAKLHYLEKRLRRLKTPREKLEEKYGHLPGRGKSAIKFMLKLTYPNLGSKLRSKYAAALQYVREKKKPDQSVGNFLRANGGIKGCADKEKKLRSMARKGWGAK
jgi:hypothetical protein